MNSLTNEADGRLGICISDHQTREISSHILCEEAKQSSTNGSFVASLGCDDDMDTFSLTNDGINQSWSVQLDDIYRIDWIFMKISPETYEVYIDLNESTPVKCSKVFDKHSNTSSLQQLTKCKYQGLSTTKGNRISISNIGNGPLKVFEVKPIAISPLNPNMVRNFSTFWEPESKALDGNMETYYNSEERDNATWFLKLDRNYVINWILISTRGGNYEVHVHDNNTVTNSLTLCHTFTFSGLSQQNKALECHREMTGDTIIIRKTDHGALRLYEVYPTVCPPNHYGPNCAKCRNECRSCSPKTGVCRQCRGSFYGEFCQHQCSANSTCDQKTQICLECDTGQCCESKIITDITPKVEEDKDPNKTIILLSAFLVLVVILISGAIVVFIKRKKNLKNKSDENGLSVELHRAQSRNESELEEIPQNEADYVEEETITVEYSNLTSQRYSIDQFISELPLRKSNGTLEREFKDLPFGLLESHSNAVKAQNMKSNRYKGIYPYDHNRVKLIRTDVDESNDYLNASYIHGFNRERAYIAAQGPFNPKTLEDFWTVIWQNDTTRIVMLTNLYEGDRMKCLKYWPDTDLDIGLYTITLDTEDVYNNYILRYLVVQYQDDKRRVTQFHFTTWPDNSVPQDMTSLICFRNLVRNGLTSSDGPIFVHCSAGIGRTGTFIALDYLLEEGAAEQTIDVKGYIASLRHQRGKSVQTYEQYIFLHDALTEGFTNNSVRQSCLSVL